ncbi:hypothetical protein M0L20_28565 [Spirosoma sp. RP8]|uniref:Carboxypeptidase regulatory-like domain-containing protein n=1 Tax=Spirosoma liriopis TaxID=2937440 RepID=A0ABT0HUM4_9BACT|nr:hypothetical protein [Spirosoma liriopis]MCK8495853.1 hypothetical protein [Spirosoma liriopis]
MLLHRAYCNICIGLLLTSVVVLMGGCDPLTRGPEAGFGGNASIKGIVTIDDIQTGQKIPVSNAIVRLGFNNSDSTANQLSTTTNAGGYYEFTRLQGGLGDKATYYLTCINSRKELTSSITYIKMDSVQFQERTEQVTKDLHLQAKAGLFSLVGSAQINDVLTGKTTKQSGVQILLKRQTTIADRTGYVVLTDALGNFLIPNLVPEKYTLDYKFASPFNGDSLRYSATYSFTTTSPLTTTASIAPIPSLSSSTTIVNSIGTTPKVQFEAGLATLTLRSEGDLILLVVDTDGVPQPSLTYSLYANKTLFDTYKDGTHSIATGTTNAYGRALIRNLVDNKTYYLRVYDDAKAPKLSKEEKITASSPTSKTITVE